MIGTLCRPSESLASGDARRRADSSVRGLSLSVVVIRCRLRLTGQGIMHCHRCGGDRPYLRCRGRRWIHLLRVPVVPFGRVAEHVQCWSCRTRYRPGVLALPTAEAMQQALPVASLAAVTTMLRAGSPASVAARQRAIQIVRSAGLRGYDEASLSADLAAAAGRGLDISAPLSGLAAHLEPPAPEWFLADVIRVGLADGPLSGSERSAARLVAAHLGLSAAQAQAVIVATEENAAAG